MARLPIVSDDEAKPEARAIYDGASELLAFVSNATRTLANAPAIAKWIIPMIAAIQRGGPDAMLDPRVKELAIIRTSTLNQCHF